MPEKSTPFRAPVYAIIESIPQGLGFPNCARKMQERFSLER